MSDDIDRAQAREQQLREDALRDHARRAGLQVKRMTDPATECTDCNAPIPEARRKAVPGCTRCVKCESAQELKKGWPL